jgi:hypothetical protein
VAIPRSEAWRIQALSGTEAVPQIRDVTDPTQLRFDEAYRRIGELDKEVELPCGRCEKQGLLVGRKSRT